MLNTDRTKDKFVKNQDYWSYEWEKHKNKNKLGIMALEHVEFYNDLIDSKIEDILITKELNKGSIIQLNIEVIFITKGKRSVAKNYGYPTGVWEIEFPGIKKRNDDIYKSFFGRSKKELEMGSFLYNFFNEFPWLKYKNQTNFTGKTD